MSKHTNESSELEKIVTAIEEGPDADFVCRKCGENYDCHPDCEPSALCNSCAQDASYILPPLLRTSDGLYDALRKFMDLMEATVNGTMTKEQMLDAIRCGAAAIAAAEGGAK